MLQGHDGREMPGVPLAPAAPVAGGQRMERLLQDTLRRAVRAPNGRMALVLHLSALAPRGPRPHHRRIAHAILDDTARRHEGQVFALGNGDMVLLCRRDRAAPPSWPAPGLAPSDPAALPATMARLLRTDLPDPDQVTTLWRLEEAAPALDAYVASRLAERGPAPDPSTVAGLAGQTRAVEAIAALVQGAGPADLLQRQTAVLVTAASRRVPEAALRPLFTEVTFSIAALEARIAATGQAEADPYLFRHLAGRLDERMLTLLTEAAGRGGVLDVGPPGRTTPPLHINLTLAGLSSEAFARFLPLCQGTGLGIEVPLVEACADPAAFALARALLAELGLSLVLDGVSHQALSLARPDAFRPELMKLEWSPALSELPGEERLQVEAALERIGPHRIVLQRAGTEAALRWGLAHGIRRFQGRHVDTLLAAARMRRCSAAGGCTLRQCMERAAATGPAGRAGCSAQHLLDDVVPPPAGPAARRVVSRSEADAP